ncbi:hypothetical protein K491DRAFT_777319 [Lophiostoma macrostomum CBS 122681]|uniref:Uncharacterized protein n=1 Tax=Lophiostoma macrostomum CBS 122681 TaxID=1314788 RepID=A0A6A6TB47_9PLEO|nr:hypothetical protein K491DRAFT_777319 [Lophiostoma macrostomum CBS 122681]
MADPGFIAAVACAGIFGTVILWAAVYFLHRFITDKSDEVDRFFDWLANRHRCRCRRDDVGAEKGTSDKTSHTDLAETSQRLKENEKRSATRLPKKTRERMPRVRPPTDEPTEPSMEVSPPPALRRPRTYPRIAEQEFNAPMPYPYALPMPHQFGGQMAPAPTAQAHPPFMNTMKPQTAPPPPPAYYPEYEQQHGEEREQRASSETEQATEVTEISTSHAEPSRIDFVCFVDELPPMFLSAHDQNNEDEHEETSCRSRVPDQNAEDQATEDIQQIPRPYIPMPVPRAYQMMQQPYQQAQPQYYDMGGGAQQKQGYRGSTRYAPYAKLKAFRRKQRLRRTPPAGGKLQTPGSAPLWPPSWDFRSQPLTIGAMGRRKESRIGYEQEMTEAVEHNEEVSMMGNENADEQGEQVQTFQEQEQHHTKARLSFIGHATAPELNPPPNPILLPPPPATKTSEATTEPDLPKPKSSSKTTTPPSPSILNLHQSHTKNSASRHGSSGSSKHKRKSSSEGQGVWGGGRANSPSQGREEDMLSGLGWETET